MFRTHKSHILATTLFSLLFNSSFANNNDFQPNSVIAYFDTNGELMADRNNSEYYRLYIDTVSGCYLAQDFYSQNDQKQTDPICFLDPNDLSSWNPQSLQGPLTFWTKNGRKEAESFSYQDAGKSALWKTWDEQDNLYDFRLFNGDMIITYFDTDGNRQIKPSKGGTFRTISDYDEINDLYTVIDYYYDSQSIQSSPVQIKVDDLLRWDIQYRNGTYLYYDEFGNISNMENYKDGLLDGTYIRWDTQKFPPQKTQEINFKEGLKNGLFVTWYGNGFPQIRMNFKNDDLTDMRCWDEQLNSLDPIQCPALLEKFFDPNYIDQSPVIQEDNIFNNSDDDSSITIEIDTDENQTTTLELLEDSQSEIKEEKQNRGEVIYDNLKKVLENFN